MVLISVNTLTEIYCVGIGMAADLKYVELCARQIAKISTSDKSVVEKSTLPVRTAQSIKTILDAKGKVIQFKELSNPEFLAEGTAIDDLNHADRVLIGGDQDEDELKLIECLVEIYALWLPKDCILTTNLWSS